MSSALPMVALSLLLQLSLTVTGYSRVGEDKNKATEASIQDYPFYVKIFDQASHKFIGSGSILNERWLITAARLLEDGQDALVEVGSDKLRVGKQLHVQSIIMHEKYDVNEPFHDIMLLKLTEDLEWGPTINEISLPSEAIGLDKFTDGQVVGMGDANITSSVSPGPDRHLGVGNLSILKGEKCKAALKGNYSHDHLMCTRARGDKHNACAGDPGSPLFVKNPANKSQYILLGVLAFGASKNCTSLNHPTYYTRVSQYTHWINEQMQKYSLDDAFE